MQNEVKRITGNVRVETRASGRVWVAAYIQAGGKKTRKVLGPAWVKDTGKVGTRGAPVWRAASGEKPDATYLTPKDAQDALAALLAGEKAKPAPTVRKRGHTVKDATDAWLHLAESRRGVSPSTLRGYGSHARAIQKLLGADTPVSRLHARTIQAAHDQALAAGEVTRTTVHHRFKALDRVLSHAVTSGFLSVNPVDAVDVIPMPKAEPDFNVLEPSQVEAVARAIAEIADDELPLMPNGKVQQDLADKMRATRTLWSELVRVAAYTGLRAGELRALRWRDLDWTGQVVRVVRNAPAMDTAARAPKSKHGRSVPLIPQAIAALDRVSKMGHPTGADDLVFPSLAGGMFDGGRVRTAFYDGLDAAGLGHVRTGENPMTFHDLRHTFGTIAARVFPLADVQAYLGHADISTTMRYAHHVPRQDAASRLAAAFGEDIAADVLPAAAQTA